MTIRGPAQLHASTLPADVGGTSGATMNVCAKVAMPSVPSTGSFSSARAGSKGALSADKLEEILNEEAREGWMRKTIYVRVLQSFARAIAGDSAPSDDSAKHVPGHDDEQPDGYAHCGQDRPRQCSSDLGCHARGLVATKDSVIGWLAPTVAAACSAAPPGDHAFSRFFAADQVGTVDEQLPPPTPTVPCPACGGFVTVAHVQVRSADGVPGSGQCWPGRSSPRSATSPASASPSSWPPWTVPTTPRPHGRRPCRATARCPTPSRRGARSPRTSSRSSAGPGRT